MFCNELQAVSAGAETACRGVRNREWRAGFGEKFVTLSIVMNGKTLRGIRICVAVASFLAMTGAIAGAAWLLPAFGQLVMELQIVEAVMSFSLLTFIVWLLVTLGFGRIYCSTVCPVGTLQDIFSRLPRLNSRMAARRPYRYRRPVYRVQYLFLVVAVVGLMAGVTFINRLLDPATVYADIVSDTAVPAAQGIANATAGLGHATGWWDMAPVRVVVYSVASLFATGCILLIIAVTAWRSGRTICNTVCPVGTTLGFVSRYAIMQIDIDTDKCVRCNRCVDRCKSGCINPADWTVDGARCVDCFDCLTVCPNSAIRYTWERKQLSEVMMQRVGKPGEREAAPTASVNPELSTSNATKSDR